MPENDEQRQGEWVSVRGVPTHGTAEQVHLTPFVPRDKREREAFWVYHLAKRLTDFQAGGAMLEIPQDDSNGGDDVVICTGDGRRIGVQVVEMTSELLRARDAPWQRFTAELLAHLARSREFAPPGRYQVSVFARSFRAARLREPMPSNVAAAVREALAQSDDPAPVVGDGFTIHVSPLRPGDTFYVPNNGVFGIGQTHLSIERSIRGYTEAVEALVEKKAKSRSPWLLIWSTAFLEDAHWLGNDVLAAMKARFAASQFDRVYFLFSHDARGHFEANLQIHQVK